MIKNAVTAKLVKLDLFKQNRSQIFTSIDTTIKSQSKYQCILGISGGVDSSYLAFKLKEMDIRVLLVHVDCGWDTNLASQNIELIINQTGFDYYTMVPDWSLLKKMQISYLKSGVYNQDVPQDHAFVAGMYIAASKFKIKNMISGHSSQLRISRTYGSMMRWIFQICILLPIHMRKI